MRRSVSFQDPPAAGGQGIGIGGVRLSRSGGGADSNGMAGVRTDALRRSTSISSVALMGAAAMALSSSDSD